MLSIPTYTNAQPTPPLPHVATDRDGNGVWAYITEAEINIANRDSGSGPAHGFPATEVDPQGDNTGVIVGDGTDAPLHADPRGFGEFLQPVLDEIDRQGRFTAGATQDEVYYVRTIVIRRPTADVPGAIGVYDPRMTR